MFPKMLESLIMLSILCISVPSPTCQPKLLKMAEGREIISEGKRKSKYFDFMLFFFKYLM